MLRSARRSVLVLAVLAAAGCAPYPPNPLMEDARVSVNAARSNPQVASYAPWSSIRPSRHCVKPKIWPPAAARRAKCTNSRCLRASAPRLRQQVARTRSDEAALLVQRRANEAQVAADLSRRQAESAQIQATAAQRQAEEAQRVAASMRADSYAPTPPRLPQAPERAPVRGECDLRPCRGRSAAATLLGGPTRATHKPPALTFRAQSSAARSAASRPPDWRRPWAGSRYRYRGRGRCSGWRERRPRPGRSGVQPERAACEYVPISARPDYWDVTYIFGGYEHRVQMTTPPGSYDPGQRARRTEGMNTCLIRPSGINLTAAQPGGKRVNGQPSGWPLTFAGSTGL